MTDIVIVVEGGRVTGVCASQKGRVAVKVIDRDTQDLEEQAEIDKQIEHLKAQTANGRMFPVY